MKQIITARPIGRATRLAAGAALMLGVAIGAYAQDALTEEMRARIEQRLQLMPTDTPNQINVRIEDGRYVVSGFADGVQNRQDAINALREIEGLDMSLLEDRISR